MGFIARWLGITLMTLGLVCPGCSTWDVQSEPSELPAAQMSPGSVILEVEKVSIPPEVETSYAMLWANVDEQVLDNGTRRTLESNGVRVGLVGTQLPPLLRELLDGQKGPLEQLREGHLPEDLESTATYRRVECQPGIRRKLTVTGLNDHQVLLINHAGDLQALDLPESQGYLSVESKPLGDGRVQLFFTPELEHGKRRQRWVPGQGTFILEAGREKETLHSLAFSLALSPGQSLLLAASAEAKGLGGWFFHPVAGERSLMLIRLAQTQYDDLFSEHHPAEPLHTAVEDE